jgi:hypothetical protein
MATRINNIEKFLRDMFQNFRVKPSSDSWNKIADALDNTNPKDALIPEIDEIGTLFKGYKVTPSEKVWQNIYKILERDKFTVRKLSKSAVSAIVAFFSNTTATVITSILVAAGISLLFLNPFKNETTKFASTESSKQITVTDQKANQNPKSTIQNPKSKINYPKSEAPARPPATMLLRAGNSVVPGGQNPKSKIINQKSEINNPAHLVSNTNIKQQAGNNTDIEIQNPISSKDITTSNTIEPNLIIDDSKAKTQINDNLLSRYPSIKIGIHQNQYKFDKSTVQTVNLHKKMDDLMNRFYKQMTPQFKRHRDMLYLEAYDLAIYSSTTFIADQQNSSNVLRSYNEYIIGSPSNCLGLNLGYNYRKLVFETGIMYEDRNTRRNDDLTWINYDSNITVKKDSIGFVFNTIDSTYNTVYKTTIDTNIRKNELKKNYRSTMTYHTIEVPFMVGYKLINKRNTLIVRTGILASFIIKSVEETTYTDETARPFIVYPEKNKVELSYILNLSYDFNMKDNFRISVTPTFRYHLTGLYKGYSKTTSPVSLGLGLGVKYLF